MSHAACVGRSRAIASVLSAGEPLNRGMQRLNAELDPQFPESARLEKAIRKNLRSLGYGR